MLALAVLLTPVVSATAEVASTAPINDSYLGSVNLNQPGHPLDRMNTLTDIRDTRTATLQTDIFNPPHSGGPPEVSGCNGIAEGKTIWYDFYPDANGLVRIRTSAEFSAILAVMAFDRQTLLPENASRKCVVNQLAQVQELFYEVKAGGYYTIQIGGANNAGGKLQLLFDYLVKPKPVQAEATLTAQPVSGGLRVVNLSVSAPKKARVLVRCTRGCGTQAMTARAVSFPRLRGIRLANGSALKIYVTAKNQTGAYIEYKIRAGSFSKSRACLPPGATKPVACE